MPNFFVVYKCACDLYHGAGDWDKNNGDGVRIGKQRVWMGL